MADFSNGNPPEQPSESNSNEVKSPIVMRIDAPEAEKAVDDEPPTYSFAPTSRSHAPYQPSSSNSFGSDLKFCSSSSSNHRSFGLGVPNPMSFSGIRTNAAASPFGSGLFGSSFSKPAAAAAASTTTNSAASPKPLLLRPSQLAVGTAESSSSSGGGGSVGGSDAVSSAQDRIVSTSDSTEPDSHSASTAAATNSSCETATKEAASSQEKNEPSSSQAGGSSQAASQSGSMMFVPLGASSHHKDDSSSVSGSGVSSSVTGFVFGQNLHARAATAAASVAVVTADSTSAAVAGPSKAVTSNGTSNSEMLFTSVIRSEPANADSSVSEGDRAPSKSLSEAAAEYEESRAVKRKYDEVAVFTGEEDEANVIQVNCKLFAYDKANGQWVERGRGTLRLNDKDGPNGIQSRVVMRTAGSLRVVLNTKIWGGMSVDRTSPKSISLTAMEGAGQIKVFLVMASPKEIEALHKCLQSRVLKRQLAEGEGGEAAEPEPTAFQNKRREVRDAGGGGGGGDEPAQ